MGLRRTRGMNARRFDRGTPRNLALAWVHGGPWNQEDACGSSLSFAPTENGPLLEKNIARYTNPISSPLVEMVIYL